MNDILYLAIENADLDSFKTAWSDQYLNNGENSEYVSNLLLRSIQLKSKQITEFLLSKPDIDKFLNYIGSDGYNALSVAITMNEHALVKRLIELGAETNATLPVNEVTLLHIATLCNNHLAVIELLQNFAIVDAVDADLRTPLMYAALQGSTRIASLLLQKGALLDKTDVQGMTALHLAALKGQYELCELLLSKGADSSVPNQQQKDARDIASENGHKSIVDLISRYRRDSNSNTQSFRDWFTLWNVFSFVMTLCMPGFVLSVFGIKNSEAQQAWREKIMFCQFVVFLSVAFGFLCFGLSTVICTPLPEITIQQVQTEFAVDSPSLQKYVIIRGVLYEVGVYTRTRSHPPGGVNAQPPVVAFIGKDASGLFPLPQSSCPKIPNITGCQGKECHGADTFGELEKLSINQMVSYSWDVVQNSDRFMVYNGLVYDVKTYFDKADFFLGEDLNQILKRNIGRDATLAFSNSVISSNIIECMKENLLVGKLQGESQGCFASQTSVLVLIIIFTSVTLIKYVGALTYTFSMGWAMAAPSAQKRPNDYVIVFVPCYSEDVAAIQKTLYSVVDAQYPDNQKLIFVVADGVVYGKGNDRSTADIVLDFIDLDMSEQGQLAVYNSVAHDEEVLNRCKVYSGFVKGSPRRVPIILAAKVGNVDEEQIKNPGNRGKRDSQLLLMNLLCRTLINERFSPLEFALFSRVRQLSGVYLDRFDHVLMIDADTELGPKSLMQMTKCMYMYPQVMALCGETRLSNKWDTFITMCQVFEYYIAHFLGKSFESLFGIVTCLPGCMSMYRIRQVDSKGVLTPILANPDLVEAYGSCDTGTLHKKNLLMLGEDRFLTTLLLKTFPRRDTLFLPEAYCETTVPESLSVLLSQRRRWINSTVHNLYELLFVNKLCGIFCFSMQFIVFLDLLGTLLSPAAFAILIYIIVQIVTSGLTTNATIALVFIAMIVALNVVLVLFPLRSVWNFWWMLVYLVSTPLWQVIMPVYSFYHSDDFTWGKSRKLNKTIIKTEDDDDPVSRSQQNASGSAHNQLVLKRWHQWEHESIRNRKPHQYKS
ncbi:hypothetical protein MP228_000417 [Amoeboaphelidium protococcarum]|nr:hypothetical protein MP228_000417 [Amoeboaphelidium protococcarum]